VAVGLGVVVLLQAATITLAATTSLSNLELIIWILLQISRGLFDGLRAVAALRR
jgi:hypothetical protein